MLESYRIFNNSIIKSENANILYYYEITDDEKKQIMDDYSIDPHTLMSALDPDEVPRLEVENDKLFIIWKIPTNFKLGERSSLNIMSIGIFLVNDILIILSTKFDNFFNEKINLQIKSFMDVILALQNITTKHFIEHLKIIKLMSRDIQKKINKAMENEYLLQMFNLSEILVYYLDAINGDKIVLNKFYEYLKAKNISINFNFFNDIIVENEQASKQGEIYSAIFAGLMDARGTIINNNMNVLIKNLTIINIIFLPLNLIAGILGMSEYSIMTNRIPWPISYGIFTIAMIIIGWISLLMINKMGNKDNKKPPHSR